MRSGSFKNVINKMYLKIIYLIYMNNLALNNLQWLICHKTKPNHISSSSSCRATGTDIPDPLSPLLPIVHRL